MDYRILLINHSFCSFKLIYLTVPNLLTFCLKYLSVTETSMELIEKVVIHSEQLFF